MLQLSYPLASILLPCSTLSSSSLGNNQSPTSYCLLPMEAATAELGSDVVAVMEARVEEQEEMGMILVMILLSLLGEDLGF